MAGGHSQRGKQFNHGPGGGNILPAKFKCSVGGEWKPRCDFSQNQINKYMKTKSADPSLTPDTASLICRVHAMTRVREINCYGPCNMKKSVEHFSKSQRNDPEPWCMQCTHWKERNGGDEIPVPPPNGDISPEELFGMVSVVNHSIVHDIDHDIEPGFEANVDLGFDSDSEDEDEDDFDDDDLNFSDDDDNDEVHGVTAALSTLSAFGSEAAGSTIRDVTSKVSHERTSHQDAEDEWSTVTSRRAGQSRLISQKFATSSTTRSGPSYHGDRGLLTSAQRAVQSQVSHVSSDSRAGVPNFDSTSLAASTAGGSSNVPRLYDNYDVFTPRSGTVSEHSTHPGSSAARDKKYPTRSGSSKWFKGDTRKRFHATATHFASMPTDHFKPADYSDSDED